jgi:hypothetical protein
VFCRYPSTLSPEEETSKEDDPMKTILMLWFAAMYSNVTVTEYADTIEVSLAANRDAYLSGAHTSDRQTAALQYYDQQWAYLKSPAACGERLLGAAGVACIADRSLNGRWPWERYYRDPIVLGRY